MQTRAPHRDRWRFDCRRPLALVLVAALGGAIGLPAPARAGPPLSENKYINDALFSAAVGNIIQKECPSISPRMVRVLLEARALKAHALREGYSEAEIEAFIDSDADKDRIEAAAEAWLAEAGARRNDPQSYCEVGMDEIGRGSLTGRLLRAD